MSVQPALSTPSVEPLSDRYVCRKSDNVISAIEKCLDNGAGSCFVLDDDDRLAGQIYLDGIRQAVLDGTALCSSTLERHMIPISAQHGSLRNDTGNDLLHAVVDRMGHLTGIRVDRSRQPIQLAKPDLSHREFRALFDAFLSSWISSRGPYVGEFERDFCAYVGARNGVAVTNGTVALHLALVALEIGPGDEVIVPDLTFAATINAVLYCGATPVIVDVDCRTGTLNAQAVQQAITPRTKAVIPVHLYGRPAAMAPIVALARANGLAVIEDCAEAHGARYDNRMVGQFGDIACFSFYANKIVATGEGGMCLTDSDDLARKLRGLRDHGMSPERCYWHETIGYNYRLTNLQAAIGQAQLRRIDETLDRNAQIEASYRAALSSIGGVRFFGDVDPRCKPVVWLSCVLVEPAKRDAIVAAAKQAGIEMRPFFHCLSLQPPYRKYGRHCPNSSSLSAAGINLPTSRDVDDTVIGRVADVFRHVLG